MHHLCLSFYQVLLLTLMFGRARAPRRLPFEGFREYQLFPPNQIAANPSQPAGFDPSLLSALTMTPLRVSPANEPIHNQHDTLWQPSAPRPMAPRGEAPSQSLQPRITEVPPWDLVVPSYLRGPRAAPPRWQINRFTAADGRTYGPLVIGGARFHAGSYPLDLSLFRHLYQDAGIPVNFELLSEDNRASTFTNLIFRPEPQILCGIERLIATSLLAGGLQAHRVRPHSAFLEGQFAWPPVKIRANGITLEMSHFHRNQIEQALSTRLATHRFPSHTFFHLLVPSHTGYRHVLMAQLPAEDFTNVYSSTASSVKKFWVLLEGLLGREGETKMALLGGLFLSRRAVNTLQASGRVYAAFPPSLGGLH